MKKRATLPANTPKPAPTNAFATPAPTAPLWLEGLTDASGFLAGTALAYGVGHLAGLDIFALGYSPGTMAGIVLVGLGGGFGLQAARHWRRQRLQKRQEQLDAQVAAGEK